ncbi:hypothetical protein Tco_0663335 [Tanacetum coccineum]
MIKQHPLPPTAEFTRLLETVTEMKDYYASLDMFKQLCSLGITVDDVETVIKSCCRFLVFEERLALGCSWAFQSAKPEFVSNCLVQARGQDHTMVTSAHQSNSIYIVTSVLTQRELDHHCSVFNISADLRPELPDRNATIKDSLTGKIGMYTCFIEFFNFQIPLSKFLLCVLEYYQISLSQLPVIGAAKVSHFEIMCRVLGRVPTVGTFRRLYVNSISNGWLSFSKRGGVDDPCCYSKKFDSDTSVVKDPLSVDETVDLPCVKLLNENHTIIRKYPGIFLCLVGLSRLFTEIEVRPILLYSNDEEMGLLDFVNSVDPFKVKTGEQTLAENEVPLLKETEDRVISPSSQTISLVDHTIQDELNINVGKRKKIVSFVFGSPLVKKARAKGIVISDSRPSTTGKSPTALRRLINQSGQADIGSGSAVPTMKDTVSFSVTPTLRMISVVPLASSTQAGVNVPVTEPASDSYLNVTT